MRFASLTSCLTVFFTVCFVSGCEEPNAKPVVPEQEVAAAKALTNAGAVLKNDESGRVVDADLRKCDVNSDLFKNLSALSLLRSLNLSGTNFSDEHCVASGSDKPVIDLLPAELSNLDLRDCKLSDAATPALARFTKLRALRFSGKSGNTTITDEGLVPLKSLKSLKLLALDDLWITDAGISSIAELGQIEELYLAATVVEDNSIATISKLPSLKKLRLSKTSVSDAALESLKACKALQELDLSENSIITDAGLVHLAAITSLKKLNLWRVQITDAGALALAPLVNLEWLNLDNTKLSDAGLPCLKDMNRLTFLHLGSTQITEAGAPALFHLKTLKDLKITRTALGASEAAVADLKKNLPTTQIQVEYEGQ